MIHQVGKEGYGLWRIVLSLIFYFLILSQTIDSGSLRYISFFSARKDRHSLLGIVASSQWFFWAFGCLTILSLLFFAPSIASFLNIPAADINEFKQILAILGFAVGLGIAFSLYPTILFSKERFVEANLLKIFIEIVRFAIILIMVLNGKGLIGLAYAFLAASVLSAILNFLLNVIFVPDIPIIPSRVNSDHLKKLVFYGSGSLIVVMGGFLGLGIDNFIIAKTKGLVFVAVYGIAALFAEKILSTIPHLFSVARPRTAAFHATGDSESLRGLISRQLIYSSIVASAVLTFLFVFGGNFIFFWVGKGFGDAVPVLWALSLGIYFEIAQRPTSEWFFAVGRQHHLGFFRIAEGLLHVGLSILLVFKMGIIGVAIGFAAAKIAVNILLPFYAARVFSRSYWWYVKPMVVSFSASLAVIMAAWLSGWLGSWTEINIFSIVKNIFLFGLYYVTCLFGLFYLLRIKILFLRPITARGEDTDLTDQISSG